MKPSMKPWVLSSMEAGAISTGHRTIKYVADTTSGDSPDANLARLDAVVLGYAGLARIGRLDAVAEIFEPDEMLPAPGQGALGLEIRSDDQATRTALQPLEHVETAQAVAAERALLAELDSGCQAAVAAYTGMRDGGCVLYGRVTAPDGAIQVTASSAIDPADPAAGGVHVARLLLAQGAASLLAR